MRGRTSAVPGISRRDGAPLSRGADDTDLFRFSRHLFNAGLFMSSLLAIRSFGGVTLGDALLVASALLLVMSSLGRGSVEPTAQIQIAVVLVVLSGITAIYRTLSVPSDLAVTIRLVYLVGVLPWQARTLLPDLKALARAVRFWLAGAALCGVATLAQARFGAGIIPGSAVTSSGRFSGLAQTVSDTGGITCVAVAVALGGLAARTSIRVQWMTLTFLGFAGIGLLLSGSVSGILAAVGAAGYLLLRRGLSARRLLAMAGIALVVLQVVGLVQHNTNGALTPLQRIEQATGLGTFTVAQRGLNTSQSRLDTDLAGWRGFKAHPLVGSGLDPASGIVDQQDQFQVHNLILGAAYQGGLTLVIALLLPIMLSLRRGWQVARTSVLASQLYAGLVAALLFALTAPSDYNRYFWIPIALVAAVHRINRDLSAPAVAFPSSSVRTSRLQHVPA